MLFTNYLFNFGLNKCIDEEINREPATLQGIFDWIVFKLVFK